MPRFAGIQKVPLSTVCTNFEFIADSSIGGLTCLLAKLKGNKLEKKQSACSVRMPIAAQKYRESAVPINCLCLYPVVFAANEVPTDYGELSEVRDAAVCHLR